jgi:hypothetical protein
MRKLGCRELFVQWLGIEDDAEANRWLLGPGQITDLLDICQALGMKVHLGVPFHQGWWNRIGGSDSQALALFLRRIADGAQRFMQQARWPRHAAFQGWYLPYELEQYHWASPERAALLTQALLPMARAAAETSGRPPTISTYFSHLHGPGSLEGLWRLLLDRLELRPMIQDGVGVSGLGNLAALAPLSRMLLERRQPFDLIVELFEQQVPIPSEGAQFQAVSANFRRVQRQWDLARGYGAQRIVTFALDPWVLGDSPQARALKRRWQSAIRAQ